MDLALLLILLVHICYFFQLIVLLKPDFDCSSSFALSRVDKVTTQGFVSVIANVVAFASLDTTHLLDQVEIRLISQLKARVLQKFIKYLNDTAISTSFLPLAAVLTVIFY